MERLPLEADEHALVIVAHPDDETIWMGGTLARRRDVHWTIFVLCRKSDPDRMPKFLGVAEYYGARGIICDLEDEGIMGVQESIPTIKKLIREELPKEKWDALFVHGANGEYGHDRHKGVHRAVMEMLETRELRAKNIFCFAYRLDKDKKIAAPRMSAPYAVELTNREWKAKRNVIKRLYGFQPHVFENRSCGKIERFMSFKIEMPTAKI